LPYADHSPFAYPVHYYPAYDHDKYTCQNDQARIGKKFQPCKIKPLFSSKRGINIDKNQGKKGSKKYQPDKVLLFIEIMRYWFLEINHRVIILFANLMIFGVCMPNTGKPVRIRI
jgi:hypothetical protein